MDLLENYRTLVERVDALAGRIEEAFSDEIACHRGCDSCCRHLSVFPVEGYALARALEEMPEKAANRLRGLARKVAPDAPCPLLKGGECLLYSARPIICRTHGLPLLTGEGGERRIDFCPQNFTGAASLPAEAVINLDLLNATLATVNGLFVAEKYQGTPPEAPRLSLADALLSSW
ncbi:YkgJ family cysteine cluster protein [uncultured Desulfuromonas sp.]|uniref:YkgJ family cysteine cluster protein n=1 Tax=uncultured Desulfuromonas sp. TaxID=181013 RepID=UPI00260A3DF7|nr:YkgJ family cysteine cluster protein [uncultured Desulfuromonas sp.]